VVHGSGRWFVRSADSVLGQTGSVFKDACECWSCQAKAGFPKKDGATGEKRCLEAAAGEGHWIRSADRQRRSELEALAIRERR